MKKSGIQICPNKPLKLRLIQHWQLYLLLAPAVLYLILFNYAPLYGLIIAFKDYKPYLGYWESPFVGFGNFIRFFNSNKFGQVLPNTIILSFYSLIAGFPFPIILALCLNYLPSARIKKLVQNITYAPYFISTVVLVSMLTIFFSQSSGLVNNIRDLFGLERLLFMGDPKAFRHLYVWSGVWQTAGYSSIIYIAALSGVSPELQEAAIVDGATRIQRIIHVDIPCILPTIVIMLIFSCSNIVNIGMDKIYLSDAEFTEHLRVRGYFHLRV